MVAKKSFGTFYMCKLYKSLCRINIHFALNIYFFFNWEFVLTNWCQNVSYDTQFKSKVEERNESVVFWFRLWTAFYLPSDFLH